MYIGLDHQQSLGLNGTGLSLSEFYESYASTEGSNLDGGTITDGGTGSGQTVQTTANTTTADSTTTETESETGTEVTTTEDDNSIIGDINEDGSVTNADMILLLEFLLGKDVDDSMNWLGGDVDEDGSLTGMDLARYRQYFVGTIDAFS